MTMQRRALASFTGSMYEDEFKLIVPVTQPETDYIAKMMGPLKPFTYPAWFWILFSVLYFSVSFSYIERRTMLEETEEDEYSLTKYHCTIFRSGSAAQSKAIFHGSCTQWFD